MRFDSFQMLDINRLCRGIQKCLSDIQLSRNVTSKKKYDDI